MPLDRENRAYRVIARFGSVRSTFLVPAGATMEYVAARVARISRLTGRPISHVGVVPAGA